MSTVAFDPNKDESQNSTNTNVLNPQYEGSSTTTSSQQAPPQYVSDGNPYGSHGTPPSPQPQQNTGRQTAKTPTSGQHTNVQSYVEKNKQSSQDLGQAVGNKLTTTADQIKQNTQNVNKQFQQGMDAGSLQGWQNARNEAGQAFQNASQQQAQSQTWKDNQAQRYTPTQADQGYSPEDQALIDSNKARVNFGDGTSKDFDTEIEATNAIEEWNRLNPGYYQYGDQSDLGVSDQRLADILNVKYTGPSDLSQMKGYADLTNQSREAQTLQDLAQGNQFKGELLKQTFSNPNEQYSLGNQRLDDLLLGQGQVGKNLQDTAKSMMGEGSVNDYFNQNVQSQRELAAQRGQDLDTLRKNVREDLTQTALQRESEINQRLSDIEKNWENYPQYFRDILTNELANQQQGMEKRRELESLTPQIQDIQNRIAQNIKRLNAPSSMFGRGMSDGYYRNQIANLESQLAPLLEKQQSLSQYKDFDPNNINLGLSALEAEMLGIKGGEGLYNILSQEGGIDNLIRTAESNRNQLISRDEQSQLARLQSIAELANDYGSQNSGIDFRNQYTDRDLAGTQNALSALDMDNFARVLQGAEKDFRDTTGATNLTGYGRGKATSGGALGSKKKTAETYINQNLGELLKDTNSYRNMYDDSGINQDNINSILGLAQQVKGNNYLDPTSNTGLNLSGHLENAGMKDLGKYIGPEAPLNYQGMIGQGYQSLGNEYDNIIRGLAGNSVVGDILSTPGNYVRELGRGIENTTNEISKALFGSDKGLKDKAQAKAQAAAISDLSNKIDKSLQQQGYGNQLTVQNNAQRDMELLRLLGLLDTTNR